MKITHLSSATEIIEANGIKILTDPWLTDGAFYGTWCHYPPIDLSRIDLSDIDYIYVSHIHPDHFDPGTLAMMPTSIPVLIHRYELPFLKANIERLGFTPIEIPHGEPYDLGSGVSIEIYGADNCDPSICGKMFGCIPDKPKGSMQLDSLCVITDGTSTLVNTNDCPYEISKSTIIEIKRRHPNIDFALVGYSSASLFPHCMADYDDEKTEIGKKVARRRGLISGLQTVRALKPKCFMPFAGTYILGGAQAHKTKNMPITEIEDAGHFFEDDAEVVSAGSIAVLLNSNESFNVESGTQSADYIPIDPVARIRYAEHVLSRRPLPYESDISPSLTDILSILDDCFRRFRNKCSELDWSDDHFMYFNLPDEKMLRLPLNGENWSVETRIRDDHFTAFDLDPRLFFRALRGPRFANWNNIEIGAHAMLRRCPDTFHPQLHIALNSFHQ